MTDAEVDARIAAQFSTLNALAAANANIAACALPRPDDVRRLLALQDAVGDLSAALSHGHTDVSSELGLLGAIVLEWLTQTILAEALLPVVEERWQP